MNTKEFNAAVNTIINDCAKEFKGANFEDVRDWFGTPCNVFQYAATSERCMERQLSELKGMKRNTTFMSDLSIGEHVSGMVGVLDTVKNALTSWRGNVKYIAEFVLCVNWKSWEHSGRGNDTWAMFYSLLYERVYDIILDYYEGDDAQYLYEYLD